MPEVTQSWFESVGVRAEESEIVIAVEGDDARTWLNGQITNDLKKLTPERGVYGLVLTTKGRVLADVLAFERGEAVFFVTSRAVWPALHDQLEKYIIMEDVTLRETTLRVISIAGARAAELDAGAALAGIEATVVASSRLGESREVIVEEAQRAAAQVKLVSAATAFGGGAVSEEAWEAARVERGVPRFAIDFGEKTYPQEAGLEARAVSFQKGCYLGQEVVCMLENRGQLSRSLVRVSLSGAAQAGTAVKRGEERVGELTSVAGEHGLAMLKRAHTDQGTHLEIDGGTAIVIGPAG